MKKLAEMNGNDMSDVLCAIAVPAGNIFSDGAVIDAFREMTKQLKPNAPMLQSLGVFTATMVPVLLGKEHRYDTYAIMGMMTGKTAEEIAAQNGMATIRDLYAMLTQDVDLGEFFRPDESRPG